jgi:hypothetical protein
LSKHSKQLITRNITVADTISIPGKSETLVDVFIDRCKEDNFDNQADDIEEPSEGFKDRYQMVMVYIS